MGITFSQTPAFFDADPRVIMNAKIQGFLAAIGEIAVMLIRKNMTHNDDTGKTKESVMWRTKVDMSEAKHEALSKPPVEGVLYAGSAEPSATYIEYGTMAHSSPVGMEQFVQAIKEWGMRHGIPEDQIYWVIKYIRENGTAAKPFMQQSTEELRTYMTAMGNAMIAEFIASMGYKKMHGTAWAHRG